MNILRVTCPDRSDQLISRFYAVVERERTSNLAGIANEANLTGGENVGGSTAAPVAPEVADDDDDGDGDGDTEPEPPHRRRRTRSTIPPAAEHFDRLPDSAHIDIAALRAITGKSRATLYRWMDRGLLPPPRKLGPTHNFWTAGEIRRALSA